LGAPGTELSGKIPEKQGVSNPGGAKSGAFPPEIDADLAKVVTAWPKLGADARRSILAIVGGKV
jgi:hypothetical protein